MTDLEVTIAHLRKLEHRINNAWFAGTKRRRLKTKRKYLDHLDRLLIEHLSDKDQGLTQIVAENQSLLSNQKIQFKVTSEGGSPYTYMTKAFKGRIHRNGFLYFEAAATAWETVEMMGRFYPKAYAGTIDVFGRSSINVSQTGMAWGAGRVPAEFEGEINKNGALNMVTVDSWVELDGHVHVNRVIGDPFKGSQSKRELFLRNRSEAFQILREWKKANKADFKMQ